VKILIHYPVLNVGGAEMSVLRLTRLLARRGCQVELVLTVGGGALEGRVDPRVRVRHLQEKPGRLMRVQRVFRSLGYLFRRYDAAVVALQGLSPAFCCRIVRARTRVQWIRTDLARVELKDKVARNIERYHHKIDAYICVSARAHASLVRLHPQVADKATLLYNVLDAQSIRELASAAPDPYAEYGDLLRVVTVCRLVDRAKGLFRMVTVHKRLVDRGLAFRWFVVGDGPDRERLEHRAHELGVADSFIVLGARENPYPYLAHADVAATLSYYEGLCGAINEAKVLGKPVVATDFAGVDEQIQDGVNGLVVFNDEDSICMGLERVLTDLALRAKLTNDTLPAAIADDGQKFETLEQLLRAPKDALRTAARAGRSLADVRPPRNGQARIGKAYGEADRIRPRDTQPARRQGEGR
jgi:glycosyltransferase involved in cell wall biosynthesis